MQYTIATVSPEVASTIRAAIAEIMCDFPVRDCRIEARLDFNDEEAIFVEVDHELVDKPFDPELTIELLSTVRRRLHELGEHRFPHIDHFAPDAQRVKGW